MSDTITVIDVFRELKLEPVPKKTWAVGARARAYWEERTGTRPHTPLCPKTNGGGSHCMAVYPRNIMFGVIEKIIRTMDVEAARQGDLFE